MGERVKVLMGVGRGRAGQAAILEVSREAAAVELERLGPSGIGHPAAEGLWVWEGSLDVPEPGRTLWDGSWRRLMAEELRRLGEGLPAWAERPPVQTKPERVEPGQLWSWDGYDSIVVDAVEASESPAERDVFFGDDVDGYAESALLTHDDWRYHGHTKVSP